MLLEKCQCYADSTGKRCSRYASINSKFCWQHSIKCNKPFNGEIDANMKNNEQNKSKQSTKIEQGKSKSKMSEQGMLNMNSMRMSMNFNDFYNQRYKEIQEEERRSFLNSEIYQNYQDFKNMLKDKALSFEDYDKILSKAIDNFEQKYIYEERSFDDLTDEQKYRYLIDAGVSLNIL